jgi:hypothetical protein
VWLPAEEGRWQAHWIDGGPEEKLVFCCHEFAKREFGATIGTELAPSGSAISDVAAVDAAARGGA